MYSRGSHDSIKVAFIDGTAVIRVEGRGSFKVSPPLRQFIHRVVSEGRTKFIRIDMSDCTSMDSTFMGVLAGLASFVKKDTVVNMKLLNLSDKNRKLLVTLGVDRVVDFSMAKPDGQANPLQHVDSMDLLEAGAPGKLEAAQTSLEAHEALVDILPENYLKFKSVLEYLQEDVKNLSRCKA